MFVFRNPSPPAESRAQRDGEGMSGYDKSMAGKS
jgi:hypothetical protein